MEEKFESEMFYLFNKSHRISTNFFSSSPTFPDGIHDLRRQLLLSFSITFVTTKAQSS